MSASLYRTGRPRGRSTLLYGLLALALASSLLPGALGGAIPVPTDRFGSISTVSLAGATNGTNAAVYVVITTQQITETASIVGCSFGTCYQVKDAWANVSNPFVSGSPLAGDVVVAHDTWINTTTNCGKLVCPQAFLQCDQTFYGFGSSPSIAPIARPCYGMGVIWEPGVLGQVPVTGGSLPVYNITRLLVYQVNAPSPWIQSGQISIVLTHTLTSPSPKMYGTLSSTKLTTWRVPYLAWSIPYPKGTWSLSQTTLVWQNQTISTANFSALSSAVLVDFASFPVTFCATCASGLPTGSATFESYSLTLVSLSGTPALGGPVNPNSTGNRSGPGLNGAAPSTLSLNLGNFTQSGISDTASVAWTNNYSLAFSGAVYLMAPFLTNATGLKVYVNGNLLTSGQWTLTESAIGIFSGVADVPSRSAVVFSISFTFVSSSTPTSILFFVNGFAVTAPILLILFGVVVVGVYGLVRHAKKEYGGTAANILAVGIFILSIAYVIELAGSA